MRCLRVLRWQPNIVFLEHRCGSRSHAFAVSTFLLECLLLYFDQPPEHFPPQGSVGYHPLLMDFIRPSATIACGKSEIFVPLLI
jgi:hypothetical protein